MPQYTDVRTKVWYVLEGEVKLSVVWISPDPSDCQAYIDARFAEGSRKHYSIAEGQSTQFLTPAKDRCLLVHAEPDKTHQAGQSFFMVWCEGRRAPTVKHWTESFAAQEARRLAKLNANEKFYVLQAFTYYQSHNEVSQHMLKKG